MKLSKKMQWLKQGLWVGVCFIFLSGFTVFFYRAFTVSKWDIKQGQTVKYVLNPSNCNCDLTEEEILKVFQDSMTRWNNIPDSFFAFEDWAKVSPDSLSSKEKKIYQMLKKDDPTFRSSSPKLKPDKINVIGFSTEVKPPVAGFALLSADKRGIHLIEADIFLLRSPNMTKELLEFIVTHELGHALGLGHEHPEVASIMSYGRPYNKGSQLGADDINGATFLYPKSGDKPKPNWGCTTLGTNHAPPFFDQALLGFLFFIVLMLLLLSLTKRYQKRQSQPTRRLVLWKLFLQGCFIGGSVLMLAVACAKSFENKQKSTPATSHIPLENQGKLFDFRQIEVSQKSKPMKRLEKMEHSHGLKTPPTHRTSESYLRSHLHRASFDPIVDENRILFVCPQ